jgi:hypothetical protein
MAVRKSAAARRLLCTATMSSAPLARGVVGFLALGLVHCGNGSIDSTNSGLQNGALDAAAPGEGAAQGNGKAPHVPAEHRSSSVTCAATKPILDGSVPACAIDADCQTDGGSLLNSCRRGLCSIDACLTDDDCPMESACGCAPVAGQWSVYSPYWPNVCMPGNCRVDADCGVGGFWSPSYAKCSRLQGYYCHSPADTCVDSTDCNGGDSCAYEAAVGHFTCGVAVCNG